MDDSFLTTFIGTAWDCISHLSQLPLVGLMGFIHIPGVYQVVKRCSTASLTLPWDLFIWRFHIFRVLLARS